MPGKEQEVGPQMGKGQNPYAGTFLVPQTHKQIPSFHFLMHKVETVMPTVMGRYLD